MPTATPARRGASLARALPSPGQPSETPRRHPTASDGPSLGLVGSALSPTSRARCARSSASPHLADPEGRHVRRSPRPLPLAPTDERDDDQADVGYPSEALGIRGYAARRTLATRVARAPRAGGCGYTRGTTPRVRRPRRRARGRLSPRRQTRIPDIRRAGARSSQRVLERKRRRQGSNRRRFGRHPRHPQHHQHPGSHPSSPDAAACRARRIEDDFEHIMAGIATVSRRWRRRSSRREPRATRSKPPDDSETRARGRYSLIARARSRRRMPTPPPIPIPAPPPTPIRIRIRTRAWSPEDSEGDAVLEAAYAEAFGAAAAHAAAAAASRALPSAPWLPHAREPRRRFPAAVSARIRPGSGSGPGDVDDALRELEARMEANDRGAGGDAEEYDEFAAARIEREYLLDTSDDEDDPFATGEFGAGDRGARDRLHDDDGHHLTDASLARVRERARAERAADLVARSRAREAERDESEHFLRRLARIGVPPCSTRRLSLFPDHERRRPAGANLVDALGFQLDAELERAWASRRAGEDPGESCSRGSRGKTPPSRRAGGENTPATAAATGAAPRGISSAARRARRTRATLATRTFSGRVSGRGGRGRFRASRSRALERRRMRGTRRGTPRLLRPCWRGCRGWIPGTIGWCARWRLWRDREGGGTKRGSMRGKGTRGRSARNWRSANARAAASTTSSNSNRDEDARRESDDHENPCV